MPKTPRGKRVVDEATGRFTVVGKAPNGQAQPYFAEGKTKREVVRCLKRYIARRVTRMAVEDIGLAEPEAMRQCLSAWEVYERLGSPEGELAIAQAVIYLALAPKSNAAYIAYKTALKIAARTGSMPPPDHILNAPTKLMKDEGYGVGYEYDHDTEDAFSGQDYFPEGMARAELYHPVERGYEREMAKRMAWFTKRRGER